MLKPLRKRYDRAVSRLETAARGLPRAGSGDGKDGKEHVLLTEDQRWTLHEAAIEYVQALMGAIEENLATSRATREARAKNGEQVSHLSLANGK